MRVVVCVRACVRMCASAAADASVVMRILSHPDAVVGYTDVVCSSRYALQTEEVMPVFSMIPVRRVSTCALHATVLWGLFVCQRLLALTCLSVHSACLSLPGVCMHDHLAV